MVKKNDGNLYLVRLYRENGDLEEMHMTAPDAKVALDNVQKSFDREFALLEQDNEIPVLEEIVNE